MSSLLSAYQDLTPYFGDIHNHCAVGYGHGSLDNAFQNAQLQLDFAAITAHAYWPDIPTEEPRLAPVVAYHQMGFKRTAEAWSQVQNTVQHLNQPGRFITFLGFEWHSRKYGDHNIYYRDGAGEIIRAPDLTAMRQSLRDLQAQGVETLLIPHHIGYKQGYRGINWSTYTPEFSPFVEIMSMHGASEGPDAPYQYHHTMGPLDWHSSYQYGLSQGHIVGAVGSTDHHSAHPGSYGHGRLSVWAKALDRSSIWKALKARRTVALTGDNIKLAFSINGTVIGSVLDPTDSRRISVSVVGGGAIDYVEVLHNNCIIHRANSYEKSNSYAEDSFVEPFKVYLELGWAERGENFDWQVELELVNGELLDVEPRFRGHEFVAPQAEEEESYAFSHFERNRNQVDFTTRTWGNPTSTTPGTQGICFEVSGNADTLFRGQINGQLVETSLSELIQGPKSTYLGGFLTPNYYFHRAVPRIEYSCDFEFTHQAASPERDWYHVRVRQFNGQWAWSSPIWVEA